MKQTVILLFNSIQNLWSFARTMNFDYMEINTRQKSLTCQCNAAEINIAVEKYGARLYQPATF